MQDPHVVALYYRLEPYNNYYFQDPAPITGSTDDFDFTLEQDTLKATMKTHFPDNKSARKVVDSFLEAWTLNAEITLGCPWVRFQYDHHETIDRSPPPPDTIVLHPVSIEARAVVASASLSVGKRAYPSPPTHFVASPETRKWWGRYVKSIGNHDSLLSMAYSLLTWVERTANKQWCDRKLKNRKKAAGLYRIQDTVLGKMAEISSTRGDIETARKCEGELSALSREEEAWVRAAVRAMILRIGEYEADPGRAPHLTEIAMSALPSLK